MRETKIKLKSGEYLIMYLRKSRQDSEYETIEDVLARHERQLQEFSIQLTGETIPEERILREIVSGETISDRPRMNELLEIIKDQKCRGVLVIEPQRLSRGDLTDLGTVIASFRYSNTLVVTPARVFNLDDQYDREFFERELLRGKDYVEYAKMILNRGKKASLHEGNWIHSTAPYGYERVKVGKAWTLAIVEDEAEMVKQIFDWYVNEGIGAQAISVRLNDLGMKPRQSERFEACAIRNILENETYIGKMRWGAKPCVKKFEDGKIVKSRIRAKEYELIQGKHTPIIGEDLFRRAQERRANNTQERNDTTLKNIFAGIIKCKKCGRTVAFQSHASSRRPDGTGGRKDRLHCRSGRYCDNKSVNYDLVVEAVQNALKAHLQDFQIELNNDNAKEIKAHEKLLNRLEKESEELERKQDKLYDFLERELYTPEVFKVRNEALAQEREELAEKLKKARLYKPSMEKKQQRYYSLYEAINAMDNPTISAKQKNILLKNIIEVIYYEKNENDHFGGATLENTHFNIELVLK